jgi:hypothetical protein
MGLQSGEGRRYQRQPSYSPYSPAAVGGAFVGGYSAAVGVRAWRVSRAPRGGYRKASRASIAAGVTPLGHLRACLTTGVDIKNRCMQRPISAGAGARLRPRPLRPRPFARRSRERCVDPSTRTRSRAHKRPRAGLGGSAGQAPPRSRREAAAERTMSTVAELNGAGRARSVADGQTPANRQGRLASARRRRKAGG